MALCPQRAADILLAGGAAGHDACPALLLTTHETHTVLIEGSTNIHHLLQDPSVVLIDSLLWIDGRHWIAYLVLFTLFLAPAEHWLGHLRWITVGLTAHVGATYVSEGLLEWAIDFHQAPHRLVNAARHRG